MSESKIEEILKEEESKPQSEPSFAEQSDILIKKCLSCSNDEALKYFSSFRSMIKDILLNGMETGKYDELNSQLFQKILKIASRPSAIKLVEGAKIFVDIFSNEDVFQKFYQENKLDGLLTDTVNHFLTLLDLFDQLPISYKIGEIARKMLELIIKEDYYKDQRDAFKKLLSHEKINQSKLVLGEKALKEIDKVIALAGSTDFQVKKEIPTLIFNLIGDARSFIDQIKLLVEKIGPYLKSIMNMENGSEEQIAGFLGAMLMLVEKYIFQLEYQISYERNGIYETKSFVIKDESSIIVEYPSLLKCIGIVLNPVLLRPFDINLQLRAFYIIRRLYYLFPSQTHYILNPLNLIFSNISIYGTQPQDLKEATVFLYRVLNKEDEEDPNLKDLLALNEYLKSLKESKYYSIKAISYPKDIDNISQLRNLNLDIGMPIKIKVEAGKYFLHSLYIDEPQSVVYWKFRVKEHNIKFGIYRFHNVENINYNNIENYDKTNVEEIVKLQKVESSLTFCTVIDIY